MNHFFKIQFVLSIFLIIHCIYLPFMNHWITIGYVNGQPVNQKEDVVEEENYISQYTIDECSVLLDTLEKVCYEYKLVASLDGVYIIKSTIKDYTKGNAQLTQEFLKDNWKLYNEDMVQN